MGVVINETRLHPTQTTLYEGEKASQFVCIFDYAGLISPVLNGEWAQAMADSLF